MKDTFYFYITLDRDQKPQQSNHVGVLCVKVFKECWGDYDGVSFGFGFSRLHPNDNFVKSRGREIAFENMNSNVMNGEIYETLGSIRRAIKNDFLKLFGKHKLIVEVDRLARRAIYVVAVHLGRLHVDHVDNDAAPVDDIEAQARRILTCPYTRVLTSEQGGGYSARIKEFPGCFAEGDTAQEAFRNLEDAALGWVADQLDKGDPIPECFP